MHTNFIDLLCLYQCDVVGYNICFFKQKSAYAMRISDWSSDVCSSDLDAVVTAQQTPLERVREIGAALGVQINGQQSAQLQRAVRALERPILPSGHSPRSAERRGGKACVRTCRSRWSPTHYTKHNTSSNSKA